MTIIAVLCVTLICIAYLFYRALNTRTSVFRNPSQNTQQTEKGSYVLHAIQSGIKELGGTDAYGRMFVTSAFDVPHVSFTVGVGIQDWRESSFAVQDIRGIPLLYVTVDMRNLEGKLRVFDDTTKIFLINTGADMLNIKEAITVCLHQIQLRCAPSYMSALR